MHTHFGLTCFAVLALLAAAGATNAQPTPAGAPAPAPAAADAPVPIEHFFRTPNISSVTLSPSGRYLAMKASFTGERTVLLVADVDQPTQVRRVAGFPDVDIDDISWVNDQRILFNVVDLQRGFAEQDARGVAMVKPDGSDLSLVIGSSRRATYRTITGHGVLHISGTGGDEIIVGESHWNNRGELVRVIPRRLNIETGKLTLLSHGLREDPTYWMFDAQGEPRVAISVAEGRTRILHRSGPDAEWQLLAEHASLAPPFELEFIDAQGALYVSTADGAGGTAVLRRFDFATGKPAAQALIRTPGFDAAAAPIAETAGGRLLGLRVRTDGYATVWFDEGMKAVQKQVDERLPGYNTHLSCRRCEHPDRVVLVSAWSDQDPGQYWLIRKDRPWQMIGRSRKDIDPRRMATVEFERIRARDGRDLPVWLTVPPGRKRGDGGRAVVLVHGGPWVRGGYWGWDGFDQFLASRGYLVISPEFRGSTGFGEEHFKAGWKQWGRAMQDDVADALNWAVKQGWADAQRACIAGGSYGGYSALMGLVRHPELYRCGIAWVAVTEPTLLFESSWQNNLSEEVRRHEMPTMIGDPSADAEMLKEVSPLAQAARIKAPVLLAYGRLDARVPIEHGNKMRSALRAAGNDPTWIVYEDETHGWLRRDNQVDFARRVEAFLAEHLR
jgi:dipeptidyl aminopeptidase/acylaminoacyl peptidase